MDAMKVMFRFLLIATGAAISSQFFFAYGQVPHFLNPVSYPVPGASMAVVADVNGDGILDIVTANGFVFTGSGVSALLGNGDGTFKPARTIVAAGNPSWVVIGDFNHDGKPDIAVANQPDPNFPLTPATVGGPPHDSVSILLGNGDGTFQAPINTPTLGALKIVAADFNGDGKLDLAVFTGAGSPVQILLGHGDGTFGVTNAAVDPLSSVLIAGDFNHDGKQDLLAGAVELLGNGDGTFLTGSTVPGIIAPVVGDFNGDGIPDLAGMITNGGGRNPVSFFGDTFFGLADGTWKQGPLSIYTSDGNLVAGDFDGDGKLDIFGPGSPNPTPAKQLLGGLFLGHGDGTFTQVSGGFGFLGHTASGSAFPVFAAAGDLDRNGSPDIVIANGNGILVARNTFGHPALLAQIATGSKFVIGGTVTVNGTVSLGGPAPAGGALINLTSSNSAALFAKGNTIQIPAGAQSASFTIATSAVTASTAVTLSASFNAVKQTATLTVVPPFSVASISATPGSLFGMFGGDRAVGTVTLSGPASDGVVVSLASSNPGVLSVPVNVSIVPGATAATFPITAGFVAVDTPVTVSGAFQATTRSGIVTVRKETATVVVTKAEYVLSKSQLTIEATSTDRVGSLQIYNPNTGALIGSIPLVNVGKFSGQLTVHGALPSVAAQSSVGGLAIATVAQK
jgi:hypothetical protein